LGGPQASATNIETVKAFKFVDGVIVGEGEKAFPALLDAVKEDTDLNKVPNLTWRSGAVVIENSLIPMIECFDDIPLPAYDLNPSPLKGCREIPVESGRGCPFRCSYCSTSRFWGSRFRMKSVSRLIGDISHLIEKYEVTSIELVQDNFASSPNYVRDFCRAIKESNLEFNWGCSARLDVLEDSLIKEMADSGCTRLFFGVETGSKRIQKIINKKMDYSKLIPSAERVVDNGIKFTASFITGFREETLDDLYKTLVLMFKLRYISGSRNFSHLHILSPLPATPLLKENMDTILFDGQPSDICVSIQNEEDNLLISKHPAIFSSFYRIPTPHLEKSLLQKVYLIIIFAQDFPFSLFLLWNREKDRLVELILSEAVHLQLDDVNFFAQERLDVLDNIYHFFINNIITRMTDTTGILEMMRYEYCSNIVQKKGKHIEVFPYDIEHIMSRIMKREFDESLFREQSAVGFLFVYQDETVKTTKLADPITKMLLESDALGN
jgi:hypothetical protein